MGRAARGTPARSRSRSRAPRISRLRAVGSEQLARLWTKLSLQISPLRLMGMMSRPLPCFTSRAVLLPVVCTPPSPCARSCDLILMLIVFSCSGLCAYHSVSMLRPAVVALISTHLAITGQPAHALDPAAAEAFLWSFAPSFWPELLATRAPCNEDAEPQLDTTRGGQRSASRVVDEFCFRTTPPGARSLGRWPAGVPGKPFRSADFSQLGPPFLNCRWHLHTFECCFCDASGSLCRVLAQGMTSPHAIACPRSGVLRARVARLEHAVAHVCCCNQRFGAGPQCQPLPFRAVATWLSAYLSVFVFLCGAGAPSPGAPFYSPNSELSGRPAGYRPAGLVAPLVGLVKLCFAKYTCCHAPRSAVRNWPTPGAQLPALEEALRDAGPPLPSILGP